MYICVTELHVYCTTNVIIKLPTCTCHIPDYNQHIEFEMYGLSLQSIKLDVVHYEPDMKCVQRARLNERFSSGLEGTLAIKLI